MDQLNRQVEVASFPKRIISLVPSQTELLFYLGLADEVVGITKFCIHPEEWFRSKTRIGGTKKLDLQKIRRLQPDLIIANKEENTKEEIEELAAEFPVWISDVNHLKDALSMIEAIGTITGRQQASGTLTGLIQEKFATLTTPGRRPKTAYLIWKDPFMTIGGDTFISDMLARAGYENIFARETRYPQTTPEKVKAFNCELILLPSEPFPFKKTHAKEIMKSVPDAKVLLVDGEMFSWYGSRLLQAPEYFNQLQQQIKALSLL
jgi:ABC-type Fe3+-hydroxamate transport system substrate-binding protein